MKSSIALTWRKMPERYRLIGSKCETCGTYYFPRRQICPKCRRKGKLVDTKLSGNGKIVTYTQIHVPPTGFEDQVPYVMIMAKMEEGVNITGQLVDANFKDVHIGDRVEQTFRVIQSDDPNGLIYYGFKFRKVKS